MTLIFDQQGNWVPQDQQREWLWYYILDGHAIQDDFVVVFKDESGNSLRRVVGTNIRIYNAEEKRWHMAWISSKARRLAAFTAVNEGALTTRAATSGTRFSTSVAIASTGSRRGPLTTGRPGCPSPGFMRPGSNNGRPHRSPNHFHQFSPLS